MNKILLLLAIFFNGSLLAQTTVAQYADLLNQEHLSPKEYLLGLFEDNDIVILGERDHRDTTQYDLILDIIGDERFIRNVGHVYTEVGVINRTDWANEVLKNDYDDEQAFEDALIELYRELDFNPLWEPYNMYKYLKGIYAINKNLQTEDKITIGLTDQAFEWKGMHAEKLKQFHQELGRTPYYRDSIMAHNFLSLYDRQTPKNGRKKALLIQNRPHACNLIVNYEGHIEKRVGYYVKEKYPEKTKIVAFNWYKWVPATWSNRSWGGEHRIELTDDGKWDAGFHLSGHKSVGFDIKNTVFGLTEFDYHYKQGIRFQDVIDGLIFYKPFYEFSCTVGVPDVIDETFGIEIMRREKVIMGEDYETSVEGLIDYYNDVRTRECTDFELLKQQMEKWLK